MLTFAYRAHRRLVPNKTFVYQNWEGDWMLRGEGVAWENDPSLIPDDVEWETEGIDVSFDLGFDKGNPRSVTKAHAS